MINAMGARLASCYSSAMAWHSGEVIVWREVLNDGRPWAAHTVYVVEDTDKHLVTYIPTGTPFGFAAVMAERIAEGRFHADQVAAIEKIGDGLADRLRDGQMWWDSAWAGWIPVPSWTPVALPAGWVDVPTVPV
jgi:hypothetical protein